MAEFVRGKPGERALMSLAVHRRLVVRRRRLAVAAFLGALPCALSALIYMPPLLVWNASASTPRGLYRLFPGSQPQRGDMAIARLPSSLRAGAARRRYLPLGVPLVKRVAAARGDRVCAQGDTILVNGRGAAVRKAWDGAGRPIPRWSGCRMLGDRDVLLLGESPWSFDGRYFGVTSRADIVGRAVLLWRA